MTTTRSQAAVGTQTESMTARTTPHRHRQLLAPATLAARSLLAVDRLPQNSPERAEAFRSHMQQFAPPLRQVCPAR